MGEVVVRSTPPQPVPGEGCDDATACKAISSGSGRLRPRRDARRRIPVAAFALKKYRGSAWVSSTCDKEHATAALGDSEVLTVESAPLDVVKAAVGQNSKEDSEIAALVRGKKSGHVLVDDPSRFDMRCKGDHVEDEDAALAREALPPSGDGEVLAGGSSANKVNVSHESELTGPLLRCADVVVLGDLGPVAFEDGAGLLVDLDLTDAGHARTVEAEVHAAHAGERAQIPHADTADSFLA